MAVGHTYIHLVLIRPKVLVLLLRSLVELRLLSPQNLTCEISAIVLGEMYPQELYLIYDTLDNNFTTN